MSAFAGDEDMQFEFGQIQNAFDFASCAPYGENEAFLRKDTGQIFLLSSMGDSDEFTDEDRESGEAVYFPHENDLDLGNQLAFDFVRTHLPADYDRVRRIFSSRGAYARFKQFLESKRKLQAWYDFENAAQETALREWCQENGIELAD
jgi:hypothetical protein